MGRAQGGSACWDGQPLAQIGIVLDDTCADHALQGCGHLFRDAGATGNGLRIAKQSKCGFGHHHLDRCGQFPKIEEILQNGKAKVILDTAETAKVTAKLVGYRIAMARLFERALTRNAQKELVA